MYVSDAGVTAVRFTAWAFMYHFLNWFSKTRIIGWHQIPRSRAIGIVVLWMLGIGLYAHNYVTGLTWFWILNVGHVYLEFPLNWLCIKDSYSMTLGAKRPGRQEA